MSRNFNHYPPVMFPRITCDAERQDEMNASQHRTPTAADLMGMWFLSSLVGPGAFLYMLAATSSAPEIPAPDAGPRKRR